MANYTEGLLDDGAVILCDGMKVTIGHVLARLNDGERLAEQMNQLSEALVGYREGRHIELVERATHLKLKAENVEIDTQFREIADKISEL